MTRGEYCSIHGCKTSRKMKDVSIFTVPTKSAAEKSPAVKKWRDELINVVKRDREDPDLKRLIETDKVRICQLHFDDNQIWLCK